MTTGWPNDSDNFGPRTRATPSTGPLGVKGTTIRTGFDGYACATTPPDIDTKASRQHDAATADLTGCAGNIMFDTPLGVLFLAAEYT
jgi:hypothetical protein